MTCLISIAIVVLISTALSKAEISVPLKSCQESVVAKCQCGMGGVLEDVYIKGCQVDSNEPHPCQPCPGACYVFQNCKTCSKYECLSCPYGKNGTTCEDIDPSQTINPKKDLIQNVSDAPFQNIENITFHDNITGEDQIGRKVKVNAMKTNESSVNLTFDIEQIQNSSHKYSSEHNNTDIKLDSMVLVPKNFSGLPNDTDLNLNETSQIPKDFSPDNNAQIDNVPEICTSNCSSIDTNERIVRLLTHSQDATVEENLPLDEGVNDSDESEFKNDDNIEEALHRAPFNLSFGDTFGEEGNGTYTNEDFLKHRSPNPLLDEETIAEKDEMENGEQSEAVDTKENPFSQYVESAPSKFNKDMAADTRYISVHTYEIPDAQDYPKDHEEQISSGERDIKNDYADKTLEIEPIEKFHSQMYNFSKPDSIRRLIYDKESEEFNTQTPLPKIFKKMCDSFPSSYICRMHASTAVPFLPRHDPHSHKEQSQEFLQSPDFSGNPFVFPETKPDSLYQNRQEANAEPRSEDSFNPNHEEFETIPNPNQRSEIVQRKKLLNSKYYILEKNQNPLSLRSTDVNTNVNFERAMFPSVIDHLLQLIRQHITPHQEKAFSGVNHFINDEISGEMYAENVKNSDFAPTNYTLQNLFSQSPGQERGAPNINSEHFPQEQNPFEQYFSHDQNKLPVVKGQIIVLQLENTNGTFSGLVPQLVRSRNFELDISLHKNGSDKKDSRYLKSEHKKHFRGTKHSRKLKRHRHNEDGKKKCNPWKEDCTKHHNIEKGDYPYKTISARKMKLAVSANIGRKGSNRPDRIHIKFMKMDNYPSMNATLGDNSSESFGLNDNVNQSNPYETIMDHNSMGRKPSFAYSYPLEKKIGDSPIPDSSSSRILSRGKRSTSHFCPIPKETRHGDLDCTVWSYKKSCKLVCHEGYTSSHLQFTCMRSKNTWAPSLMSCTGESYNEPSNHMKPSEDDMEVDNGAEYHDDDEDNEADSEEKSAKVDNDDGETSDDEESDEEHVVTKKPFGKKHPKGKHVVKKPNKAHVNSIHMHEEIHEGDEDAGNVHEEGHAHAKKSSNTKHKGKAAKRGPAVNESEDEDAVIATAPNKEDAEEEEILDQSTGDDYQNDEEEGEDSIGDADYDESERKK